jgi:hypothetical protein
MNFIGWRRAAAGVLCRTSTRQRVHRRDDRNASMQRRPIFMGTTSWVERPKDTLPDKAE